MSVVRGDALNPYEMQVYRHLPGFQVRAIGRRSPGYEIGLIPVPATLLPAPADSRAARLVRRLGVSPDRVLGPAGWLRGLDGALADCDLVHAAETFIPVSEQAAAVARRRGIPLVVTCWENIPFLYDDDPPTAARKARVREQATRFVAVTPLARQGLVTEGVDPARIDVIPGALDLERFSAADEPGFLRGLVNVPAEARIVLYVGRLIREKGITELIRAFAALPNSCADAHLVVIGRGPEGPRLATAATALGIRGRVHVLAGQSYADIPRIFRGADVVAVPSLSTPYWQEQFGFVLAEAMACGRPIVTTRTGSIPDVVGDAAVLVDDYDVNGLTAAIAGLLTDPDRARHLARVGRARVEQRYAAAVVAPLLGATYRAALKS
ncbi:MAG: glycosyltransferase family 4 protein [Tetrasphaera sp.]